MFSVLNDFIFCADRNYIMPIRVAVASLLWARRHNPSPIVVHFLDCGLSDADWLNLELSWKSFAPSPVTFLRHKIDLAQFQDLEGWNGGLTVYARLVLPELLPDVDWCCYVDGDVLFVDDPEELSAYCRDSLAFVGHKNPDFCEDIDVAWFKQKGYQCDPEKYICAGFALMNLKWMRSINFTQKAFAFLRDDKTIPTCDQTALNYFCMGKTESLPEKWAPFSVQVGSIKELSCIHYVSRLPWKTPKNWRYYANDYNVAKVWFVFVREIMKLKGYDIDIDKLKCVSQFIVCRLARPFLFVGKSLNLLPSRFMEMYCELFVKERDYRCVAEAIRKLRTR